MSAYKQKTDHAGSRDGKVSGQGDVRMEKLEGVVEETTKMMQGIVTMIAEKLDQMDAKIEKHNAEKPRLPGLGDELVEESDSNNSSLYAAVKHRLPPSHEFGAIFRQVVSDQTKENHEREKRDCNVIIYNLGESKSKSGKERLSYDTQLFDELCCNVLEIDVETKEITRLGSLVAGKTRPLRVSLKCKEDAERIHNSAKKLRGAEEKFSKIVISHDLSLREREELNKLVAEAKAKNQENEASEWEFKVRSRGPYWNPKIVSLRKRRNGNIPAINTTSETTTEDAPVQTTEDALTRATEDEPMHPVQA
jgi:hypothetical protein